MISRKNSLILFMLWFHKKTFFKFIFTVSGRGTRWRFNLGSIIIIQMCWISDGCQLWWRKYAGKGIKNPCIKIPYYCNFFPIFYSKLHTLKPWYNEPQVSDFHDIVNKIQVSFWGFPKHIIFDIVNYLI